MAVSQTGAKCRIVPLPINEIPNGKNTNANADGGGFGTRGREAGEVGNLSASMAGGSELRRRRRQRTAPATGRREGAGGGYGQPGPKGAKGAATKNTKITEQSTHQAAIWAALVYASTCLSRGSRVTHVCRCCAAIETRPFEPVEAEGGASMPCGSAHRQGVGGAVAPPWGRPVGSGRRKGTISKRKKRKAKR